MGGKKNQGKYKLWLLFTNYGNAENFILAGVGIFQLALMPRVPLHCVKDKKSRQGFMPYLKF